MTNDEQQRTPIEPDEDLDNQSEADSAFEEVAPSLASLTSSVLAYQEENGRRYHALSRGKYALPNDDVESERLDLQHEVFVRTFDGELAMCPKKDGAKRVLDLGTGTGVWAIDYADAHPEAEVVGVDLSPIQPSFVPPNCSFEIDDLEKEWTWSVPFDFIFGRAMLGSFADFPEIVQKAYDQLEPGGYLELQELSLPCRCDDDTLPEDSFLAQWCNNIITAAANQGRPVWPANEYKKHLEQAGFEEVVEKQHRWPINPWPRDHKYKELGLWTLVNIGDGLEGLTVAHCTRGLGWSHEETLVFCSKVRKDIRNTRIHAYFPM
ncbi:S-adenosyl-L-methionine-dependent methyltransferase [Diplogelasinospora grovesii]|uniref:S-adenosyl-L-methionine-dependent methyltransferase n=1 Tax=Diplogelasinospora grovesii TaxID=303347 RepID=A0AAN6RZC6_9PEZI|nr:S-adenosyl-L-methionine-dependent methyltransferase [Diplogelasinospora grovesii]